MALWVARYLWGAPLSNEGRARSGRENSLFAETPSIAFHLENPGKTQGSFREISGHSARESFFENRAYNQTHTRASQSGLAFVDNEAGCLLPS